MHFHRCRAAISRSLRSGCYVEEPEAPLVTKILELHRSFAAKRIGHAFGGALALAYYTSNPRATADIDVNVEVDGHHASAVFNAMPGSLPWSEDAIARVQSDEQVRLWWGRTPVDLFFRASEFHVAVAARTVWHPFAGVPLPFLAANDLAVFKALFNRPKDWLDIAAMAEAATLDTDVVLAEVRALVGDDPRLERLRSIRQSGA
jgi:hypothetical protein